MGAERRVRFKKEKTQGYIAKEGSFESALLILRDVFPEETFGVSDTSFWSDIERRATLKPEEACFQYYLEGTGHITLAEKLLSNFQRFRSAVLTGDITRDEREEMVHRVASALLNFYPEKYKQEIERPKSSKVRVLR